jgi:HEPN domain-containing protein
MNRTSLEWLKSARDDLILVERILEDEQLTHFVAFHAQQSVEKCLKALLEANNEPVPKTHSLNRLFELNSGQVDEPDADIVHTLDELYIESRYPGELGLLPYGKPSVAEAQDFYKFAQMFFDTVAEKLKDLGD